MKREMLNSKKVLVVVDMVNGFIREGNMADLRIEHIISETKRLVADFLAQGNPVIYITDCHKKDSTELKRYPEHCIDETSESEVVDELKEYLPEVTVVKKNSTSAIFAKGFLETINSLENLEEVVAVGCCTDICVTNLVIPLANYFDEANKIIKITVPKNAVETYDAPIHPADEYNDMAFKFMAQTGINLVEKY